MNPPAKPHLAVCPGSYDPITNGHLDVIERAAEIFDEVVVAVVNHSSRKNPPLFSIEERMEFIAEATAHLPTVRAEPFGSQQQVHGEAITLGDDVDGQTRSASRPGRRPLGWRWEVPAGGHPGGPCLWG